MSNALPLTFAAGTYIFKDGNLHINNNNEIYGQDVHFHFAGDSNWIVEANAEIWLTGREAGERDAEGAYPEDSINGLVEARLTAFAAARQAFGAQSGGSAEDEARET